MQKNMSVRYHFFEKTVSHGLIFCPDRKYSNFAWKDCENGTKGIPGREFIYIDLEGFFSFLLTVRLCTDKMKEVRVCRGIRFLNRRKDSATGCKIGYKELCYLILKKS